MIPDNHALLLFKFGEYRWIKRLKDGELSFGCPGGYIDIARTSKNDEQGDLDEAIFARLKKGNPKIQEVADTLKDDLEVIDDGAYVKLRRKSSYLVPVFCFYRIKTSDITKNVTAAGKQKVTYNFDERIFSSFAHSKEVINVLQHDFVPSILTIQPGPFVCVLSEALFKKNIKYSMHDVDYSKFAEEEFFINPTDKRDELFCKYPRYKYQFETRICLHDIYLKDTNDRYNLLVRRLSDEDAPLIEKVGISIDMNVDIVEK
ncbi:MAG: hypothetical protein CVU90_01935 [Firmicutes bacterium HGW-Firmicutes-15]|nr:MAG: hypothetical protein CVU90_01935 [Firmicutes bacterium HGW-Firmicutes-15]